ncbi:hypothetical protein [Ornithinicoccus halotolerans]|uniref:hypothetical protein n=1 Tax=Ornithinicoccus halotolerans TaxID=1748220 RepID=UPI001885BC16|nr:hypothetical protein [Ornithinicoccus halotolerans]
MSERTRTRLPGRGKRRGGAITFWTGVVIALISTVLTALLGWRTYDEVTTLVEQAEPVEGSTTVTLQEGEAREIYQLEQGQERAECTVTGPDGQDLPLRRTSTIEGSDGQESYFNLGGFEAGQSGDHVVECAGPPTFVGPPLDVFGTVGSVLGVVGGLFGVGLGVVLMIVGAIIYLVGRNQDKRAVTSPQGGGGPGYRPSGGGYPPPPGGPGYRPPPPPGGQGHQPPPPPGGQGYRPPPPPD